VACFAMRATIAGNDMLSGVSIKKFATPTMA
jgi:hypothetical protein